MSISLAPTEAGAACSKLASVQRPCWLLRGLTANVLAAVSSAPASGFQVLVTSDLPMPQGPCIGALVRTPHPGAERGQSGCGMAQLDNRP